MTVIALLDRRGGDTRRGHFAVDRMVFAVAYLRAVARDDDPVALVEIGDSLRQRRERERVGTEESLPLAIADDEGRAKARADQQVRMLAKGDEGRTTATSRSR